uniref:Uncharacterized protein n=1 Tax=Polysiphonia elongata TaxID=159753 RepID=A0A1Z1MBB9_9FLOR|nr:hypothetical protein [Polysiphonia elongata]ARW63223.1 hypothetical protein [Polysiphonia elongata]
MLILLYFLLSNFAYISLFILILFPKCIFLFTLEK